MSYVRHKTFISYHHADQQEVDDFIRTFGAWGVFIARSLGTEMDPTIINSTDEGYVMQRIRELYLEDSTVTLVLVGRCTWARRYVDWELQASLRSGETVTPNGLLGVVLPSVGENPRPPHRLSINLPPGGGRPGYAQWYWYPTSPGDIANWIEDAFDARTSRRHLITNPRLRFPRNQIC